MARPRVLLAEDHPGVAEQLRALLEPEFDVVATVGDGVALLRAEDELRPDAVVTDITMPRLDGITATAALLERRPGTRVVLITVHGDTELAERGYAAGALACVPKVAAADELVPAVRMAIRGERHVVPRLRDPPVWPMLWSGRRAVARGMANVAGVSRGATDRILVYEPEGRR
jgi:DNA-binding NarL/FixJ family response regulator